MDAAPELTRMTWVDEKGSSSWAFVAKHEGVSGTRFIVCVTLKILELDIFVEALYAKLPER